MSLLLISSRRANISANEVSKQRASCQILMVLPFPTIQLVLREIFVQYLLIDDHNDDASVVASGGHNLDAIASVHGPSHGPTFNLTQAQYTRLMSLLQLFSASSGPGPTDKPNSSHVNISHVPNQGSLDSMPLSLRPWHLVSEKGA
ncbi:hypothetical protein Fmac_007891 [Flemingia macrophylla]|uniref:Uncharacterized protein n=1 Tax=Flemingia macrophylla TaxID=520843 RepID=A0ABD1MVW6_9FABA